ncbi:MAG: hydroxyacylglutathione hydrolase [Sphingomonas sp.]|nr:hydroxyacylglutathione hydrolase [Sphingomonas sp.]
MAELEILRVPVLNDNYVWLVHDNESGETLVVDPAVAEPVLAAAGAQGWAISQIWNTHWHGDHIGGNAGIVAATGAKVTAPAAELSRIPDVDRPVGEGDRVRIGAHEALVLSVPAHTAGHVAYHFADDAVVFVGDTMFAMGCGRLFEGTAEQMYTNMRRFEAMPDETRVYCAHEYTLSNGVFAVRAEPDNEAMTARLAQVEAMRARGEATVPTTIAAEKATNPFLRAGSVAELARRRAEKDKG